MREIKFRAWNKEKKEMDYNPEPYYDHYNDNERLNFMIENIQKNQILMEYTGLKDKNGKEIYEGDIVQYPKTAFSVSEPTKGVVIFNPPYFTVKGWTVNWIKWQDLEVIGNIYENNWIKWQE